MNVLQKIDRKTALTAAVLLVMAVPLAMFIYVVWTFKANVPWRDDFGAVLTFLNNFVTSQTFAEKFGTIWAQRNHRIVFPHLVFLMPLAVGQKANFDFYILFGDLGWLIAVGTLLWYLYRKYALPLWSLAPLPFVLFSLRLLDPMLWADSGVPVFWSLCFSILFCIALSEDKVAWACILFPLSFFTWGDGAVLFPLGLIYFAASRQWKNLAIFGAVGLVELLIYLAGFRLIIAGGGARGLNIQQSVLFVLTFLGGIHFATIPRVQVDAIVGGIFLLAALYFLIRKRKIDFAMLLIGLAISTAIVATYARGGFGVARADISRYSAFSMLMFVALYTYTITAISRPAAAVAVTAVTTLLMVAYWWQPIPGEVLGKGLYWQRKYRITDIAVYASDGVISGLNLGKNTDADHERGAAILDESKRLGIYDPAVAVELLKRK